jgi:hypothetical protein
MNGIETRELEKRLAKLKKAYKTEKERLEWQDNDVDEGLIAEKMASLKQSIKALAQEIESRQKSHDG